MADSCGHSHRRRRRRNKSGRKVICVKFQKELPGLDRALARRARSANLRQRVGGRLEALGRAHEDDPQRVPPDAVAEGSAGTRRQAHGRLLLRRRRRAAARIRAAADQVSRPAAVRARRPPSRLLVRPANPRIPSERRLSHHRRRAAAVLRASDVVSGRRLPVRRPQQLHSRLRLLLISQLRRHRRLSVRTTCKPTVYRSRSLTVPQAQTVVNRCGAMDCTGVGNGLHVNDPPRDAATMALGSRRRRNAARRAASPRLRILAAARSKGPYVVSLVLGKHRRR